MTQPTPPLPTRTIFPSSPATLSWTDAAGTRHEEHGPIGELVSRLPGRRVTTVLKLAGSETVIGGCGRLPALSDAGRRRAWTWYYDLGAEVPEEITALERDAISVLYYYAERFRVAPDEWLRKSFDWIVYRGLARLLGEREDTFQLTDAGRAWRAPRVTSTESVLCSPGDDRGGPGGC